MEGLHLVNWNKGREKKNIVNTKKRFKLRNFFFFAIRCISSRLQRLRGVEVVEAEEK